MKPSLAAPTICIICGRPLPRRRWWQILQPLPFHDPERDPACRPPDRYGNSFNGPE